MRMNAAFLSHMKEKEGFPRQFPAFPLEKTAFSFERSSIKPFLSDKQANDVPVLCYDVSKNLKSMVRAGMNELSPLCFCWQATESLCSLIPPLAVFTSTKAPEQKKNERMEGETERGNKGSQPECQKHLSRWVR